MLSGGGEDDARAAGAPRSETSRRRRRGARPQRDRGRAERRRRTGSGAGHRRGEPPRSSRRGITAPRRAGRARARRCRRRCRRGQRFEALLELVRRQAAVAARVAQEVGGACGARRRRCASCWPVSCITDPVSRRAAGHARANWPQDRRAGVVLTHERPNELSPGSGRTWAGPVERHRPGVRRAGGAGRKRCGLLGAGAGGGQRPTGETACALRSASTSDWPTGAGHGRGRPDSVLRADLSMSTWLHASADARNETPAPFS